MTNDERELFDERFKSLTTLMNSQFINVNDKLESIEEQTKKTNGRVTELEKMSNLHTIAINGYASKCPQEVRIRGLEDNTLSSKVVKKWIAGSIGIASALAGIIWVAVKLING